MTLELRWIASSSASSLHAVEAIAGGAALVDPALDDALRAPAQALLELLQLTGVPLPRLLRPLVALAAGIADDRQLAQRTLVKAIGPVAIDDPLVGRLAEHIGAVEAAVRKVYPKLDDDLKLRVGPLREQWEARGPGLWKAIGRATDPRLLVESAEVILVHPALGGGGVAHLPQNAIRLEAVLVNPEPRLPEALRLGWLLSQLNNDLPVFGEQVPADRLAWISPLAMLPATLAAGEHVELAACDRATMSLAWNAWRLPSDGVDVAERIETLAAWWETYQADRPDWSVALGALDQMLG